MLILIRGLPGSGKSTLAKAMLGTIADAHWEADMFFMEGDNYLFNADLLPAAHSWCRYQTLQDLTSGKCVVVSNTFTELWEIEQYRSLAVEAKVPCIVHEAKGNWKSLHNVPEQVITSMKARWHVIHHPVLTC